MNKRILTILLACAVGGAVPGIVLAAGTVTPAPIDPIDTAPPEEDCTDEVLAAIDATRAECAQDPMLCGIDIPAIIQETRDDCEKAPSLCNITLEDVLADATFGETEPNDHIVSADPLTSGVPITGQLYNPADEDWYFIEAIEPNSIITIWFADATLSWQVSILDHAGNRLATTQTVNGAEFSFDTSVAQAGVYYVVVRNVPGAEVDSLYQMSVIVNGSGNPNVEPLYNFHDVETEQNGLFSTGDRILSDIVTYGQALYWNDLDLFRVDSPGNEILHMELCYENTSCFGDDSWAMFVLSAKQYDGTMVSDTLITEDLAISVYDESYGTQTVTITNPADGTTTTETTTLDGYVDFASNHFYYLAEYGRFDNALIGKVDPFWGDETGIDIALVEPGTFYIAIIPTLKRDPTDGSILQIDGKPQRPDLIGLIAFPYNDDQYTFRVTRTQLDPSMATSLSSARATLDMKAGRLTIPEVTYEGDLYKMDMRLGPGGGRTFILETVTPVDPAALP